MTRKRCFTILVSLFLAGTVFPVFTPRVSAEESKRSGYWRFTRSEVSGPDSNFEDSVMSGGNGTYRCSARTTGNRSNYHGGDDHETSCSGEWMDVTITIQEPGPRLNPGETVSLQVNVSFSGSQYTDSLLFYECRISAGMGRSEYKNSEIRFMTSDEKKSVGLTSEWKPNDYYGNTSNLYVMDGDLTLSAQVPEPNWREELWISESFGHGRGEDAITTYYYYEWVDTSDEWEDVYDPWQEQNTSTHAPDDPGSYSDPISPGIVEGTDHSEGGAYWVLPGAVVLVGGALYLHYRRKKKKNPPKEEEKKPPRKPSSYYMVIHKDFGSRLRPGGAPKAVGARIEEHRPNEAGGTDIIKRADLTGKIKAEAIQNLKIAGTGMGGDYMNAMAAVPKEVNLQKEKEAVLEFSFTGEGGCIRSRISFDFASEPRLALVNDASARAHTAPGKPVFHLLMGDTQGIDMLVGALHFLDRPNHITLESAGISGSCAPDETVKVKDGTVFRATLKNSYIPESPFGRWPLKQDMTIRASNDQGEKAELVIELDLWPEGIFLDISELPPDWVRDDHILVDSTRILATAGTETFFQDAVMETGVAFKDRNGQLVVDRPNLPETGPYFRLTPSNPLAEQMLEPETTRIWYDLVFKPKSTYSNNDLLGTLSLTPLMPFVLKTRAQELEAEFVLGYDKFDQSFSQKVNYHLKGFAEVTVDEDRREEIQRIRRLLIAMRPENVERVNRVLQNYGAPAEHDLGRFGTAGAQYSLIQSEKELLSSIEKIQSVQRLRGIRHLLYEEMYLDAMLEQASELSWASFFDSMLFLAKTTRWTADMAFTVWWYLMFKDNGAYFEPIATAIKDRVLEYFEQLGDLYLMEQGKTVLNPFELIDEEAVMVSMMEAIEGSMFSVLITGAIDGGKGALSRKQAFMFLSLISTFVFAKNCRKYTEYDPVSNTTQVDLWNALKGTMGDLTLDLLKGIVSAVLARKVATWFGIPREENAVNPITKNVWDTFRADLNNMLQKSFTYNSQNGMWKNLYDYIVDQNKNTGLNDKRLFSMYHYLRYDWLTGKFQKEALEKAGNEELKNVTEYMLNVGTGKIMDIRRGNEDELYDHEAAFDSWALSLGNVPVEITTGEGEVIRAKIPLVAAICAYVNTKFYEYGFDDMVISLENALPKECPYWSRKRMIEEFEKIPGGQAEIRFLNPEIKARQDEYAASYADGAEAPTMNTGTDFHRYAK